jgi:hypothetical protein
MNRVLHELSGDNIAIESTLKVATDSQVWLRKAPFDYGLALLIDANDETFKPIMGYPSGRYVGWTGLNGWLDEDATSKISPAASLENGSRAATTITDPALDNTTPLRTRIALGLKYPIRDDRMMCMAAPYVETIRPSGRDFLVRADNSTPFTTKQTFLDTWMQRRVAAQMAAAHKTTKNEITAAWGRSAVSGLIFVSDAHQVDPPDDELQHQIIAKYAGDTNTAEWIHKLPRSYWREGRKPTVEELRTTLLGLRNEAESTGDDSRWSLVDGEYKKLEQSPNCQADVEHLFSDHLQHFYHSTLASVWKDLPQPGLSQR